MAVPGIKDFLPPITRIYVPSPHIKTRTNGRKDLIKRHGKHSWGGYGSRGRCSTSMRGQYMRRSAARTYGPTATQTRGTRSNFYIRQSFTCGSRRSFTTKDETTARSEYSSGWRPTLCRYWRRRSSWRSCVYTTNRDGCSFTNGHASSYT